MNPRKKNSQPIEIQERGPRQADHLRFVVGAHSRVPRGQPDHRSGQQDANAGEHEPGFPVAKAKSILGWAQSEHEHDHQKRNQEEQDQTIVYLGRRYPVIGIDDQEQRADDGHRHRLPIEVQPLTQERFHRSMIRGTLQSRAAGPAVHHGGAGSVRTRMDL